MIGIVLTTYNRPQYLKVTLDSISKCDLSNVSKLIIIDDCSKDKETIDLIKKFKVKGLVIEKIFKEENSGMYNSLRYGFDKLILEDNLNYICNIDSDIEFKPNLFNELLRICQYHENKMICSGFSAKQRHQTIQLLSDHRIKRTVGGVNMFFHWSMYLDYIRQGLWAELNWDWEVCKILNRQNKFFAVTKPSLIEHIGIESTVGHEGLDVAEDYIKE